MRMLYFGDFLLHGLTGDFYTGLNGDLPTNLSLQAGFCFKKPY